MDRYRSTPRTDTKLNAHRSSRIAALNVKFDRAPHDDAAVHAARGFHARGEFELIDKIGEQYAGDAGYDPIPAADRKPACGVPPLRQHETDMKIEPDRLDGVGIADHPRRAGAHRPWRTAPFTYENITAPAYPAQNPPPKRQQPTESRATRWATEVPRALPSERQLLAGGAGEQTLDGLDQNLGQEIRCGSGHGVLLICETTCRTCEACTLHMFAGGFSREKFPGRIKISY
ncbi:hypothetical protein ACWIGI_11270 [Nocardia sp. NPDC055321]